MVVDLFLVFNFIKRLVTPFTKWEAYKEGIIDEKGNILIKRKEFVKNSQKSAFGIFDQMILNLKKLLGKLPGGQTKLASYASALWLIREQQRIEATNYLTEESVEEDLEVALERFLSENETLIAEAAKREIDEEPANAVGGGNIAGLGIGPDGEPGVSKKNQKKHKKRIRDIMGTVKMEDAVGQANLKARQAAELDNLKDRQDKDKERTKLKHAAEAERQKAADEVDKDREKRKQERDKEREAAKQKMASN
jgi:hypothetical protein|tara:strand:+ start:2068 stop:2820 length:753 start_codon:yes stop_codon:yes gene_type:complete